jgi:hypothetical protein
MSLRAARIALPLVLLLGALPAGIVSGAAAAAPAASSPSVTDVTPLTTKLDARKRHTEFFSTGFQAQANEVRFVATELVVKDAKGTAPTELFLGVTLSCTSPSGRVTSAEAGRNVWPAGSDFVIPVTFTFATDVAGTHKCQADVMMCDPGNCSSPTGKGIVTIVSQKTDPKNYSFLYISTALPTWAQSERVPKGGDLLVKPGTSYSGSQSFDVSQAPGPVSVGGIFSITNCIEPAYPTACKGASKTASQGSARVTIGLALKQVGTAGVTCATARATAKTGAGATTITWQQHHAIFDIFIPDFTLSTKAGCSQTINVTVTVTTGKGNAVVVESGSKAKWASIMYAIPGDVVPSGR